MDDWHVKHLRSEAERLEQRARDYRVIARTDPARYSPAMKAARAIEANARLYRTRLSATLATPSQEE